ncbi:MAG: DHH family phosphoesterase [Candidatus Micrarchaeota archaeon]
MPSLLKPEILAKFDDFVHRLSPKDEIGVLVHSDPDGLASAVVLIHAVQRLIGKEPKKILSSSYGDHDLMEEKLGILEYSRCTKLIVADLSFDQDDFFVREAEKFCDAVFFLDHHKIYNDFNSDKTVFIKVPYYSDIDSSKYPASKLCFDLFSRHLDMSDIAWVAAVGILGDASGLQWKTFLEETMESTGCSFLDLDECKEIVESVGLIEPFQFNGLIKVFTDAQNPGEVQKSKFADFLSEMRGEMAVWFERFKKEAEFLDDIELIWFECKPHFPIKAPLVNKISFELHPDKTLIFVQDFKQENSHVSISARRQDGKVAVNDLLEAAVVGIPLGQAGGHAPAAGARVPREFLPQFKENIISELKKLYKK